MQIGPNIFPDKESSPRWQNKSWNRTRARQKPASQAKKARRQRRAPSSAKSRPENNSGAAIGVRGWLPGRQKKHRNKSAPDHRQSSNREICQKSIASATAVWPGEAAMFSVPVPQEFAARSS